MKILRIVPVATVLLHSQSDSPVNTVSPVSLQKINHFPGMSEICRKDLLARNMNRMLKLFPKDYNIFPRTWCLPAESVCSFCRFITFFPSMHYCVNRTLTG